MGNKSMIDLREVPNEIIMAAYAAVYGNYYVGVDSLEGLFLENFKLIINPYNFDITCEMKRHIIDEAEKEICKLSKNFSVISSEYQKKHNEVLRLVKKRANDLQEKHSAHESFYEQIEQLIKKKQWLEEKKPVLINCQGSVSIILNQGNAVYVKHANVDNKCNVLYCEVYHKEIVDNILNEVYASCENKRKEDLETLAENE